MKTLLILAVLSVFPFISAFGQYSEEKKCIEMSVYEGSESYDETGKDYKVAFTNNCGVGVWIDMYSTSKKGEEKTCCIKVAPGQKNTGNLIVSSTGEITYVVTDIWHVE